MIINNFIQQILNDSLIGYAGHKVFLNENGEVSDYQIVEINKAFEKIIGLKANDIVNQSTLKILSNIDKDEIDRIVNRGISKSKQKKDFLKDIQLLNKWYRLHAYLIQPDFLATIVIELYDEKEHLNDLKKVTLLSDLFLNQPKDKPLDYQGIADHLRGISQSQFVAFNVYNETGDKYQTMALSGLSSAIKKIMEILGKKTEDMIWKHDQIRAEKIKKHTITRFNNLHELVGDVMPKVIINQLVKTFNVGEIVLIKITKDGYMLGDFTLFMSKDRRFSKDNIAEVYSKFIGVILDRHISDKKLKQANIAFANLMDNIEGIAFRQLPDKDNTMIMMSRDI
jgi:hypothetical protein